MRMLVALVLLIIGCGEGEPPARLAEPSCEVSATLCICAGGRQLLEPGEVDCLGYCAPDLVQSRGFVRWEVP